MVMKHHFPRQENNPAHEIKPLSLLKTGHHLSGDNRSRPSLTHTEKQNLACMGRSVFPPKLCYPLGSPATIPALGSSLTLDPFCSSACDLAPPKGNRPDHIQPYRRGFFTRSLQSPTPALQRRISPVTPRWLLGEGRFWLEIKQYEGRKAKRERQEDRNRAGDGGDCRARLPQVSARHRAIFCLFLFLTAASPWQPHQLSRLPLPAPWGFLVFFFSHPFFSSSFPARAPSQGDSQPVATRDVQGVLIRCPLYWQDPQPQGGSMEPRTGCGSRALCQKGPHTSHFPCPGKHFPL